MSDGEPASATTTIGRLACRLALPREAAPRGELFWRLEQVLHTRLAQSLAAALTELDGGDPEEVWIVRTLQADVTVSADVEDLDQLAGQWGQQLAQTIIARLREGPGGEVVRFSSRAEHLAEFVAALSLGRGGSWIFEPFAGLTMLRPLAALRTGAAGAGIPITTAVAQLIAIGRLESVLASAAESELAVLWAQCVEATRATVVPGQKLVNSLRVLAAERLPAEMLTASPAVLALRLVAAAGRQHGTGADVFAAVAVIVGSVTEQRLGPSTALVAGPGTRVDQEPETGAGDGGWPRDPSNRTRSQVPDLPRVFAASGAPAFMLLRSLEQVGLARAPAGARAAALAQVLRCDTDDAVMLAAGAERQPSAIELDGAELSHIVRVALAADDRVDGRWLLAERIDHPDGSGHVGLIRDVATDLWLAGVVRDRARDIPWEQLLDAVVSDLDREPLVFLGDGDRRAWVHTQESADALERLRPAAADLAWLSAREDDQLAAALAGRAALRDLARRLLSFERSTVEYLVGRFLPRGGIVTATEQQIQVELPPAQLAVILVMAGLDRFSYRIPWLAQEVGVVHRAG